MFLKASAIENAICFLKRSKSARCLVQKHLFSWFIKRMYLFEIFQTSLTVKVKGDTVKTGCFEKRLLWRVPFFF